MHLKILYAIAAVMVLSIVVSAASELENAVHDAVSHDKNKSSPAIERLRADKQAGLDALFRAYSSEIDLTRAGHKSVENWTNISTALDSVAMQKDAYSSRLFWYTNFADAKRESFATGKPILSLRLLGNLNEEYSCANSRFFRSILYSDPAIANTLRNKYILHWESVRPAPKITIDFRDGRKLVRTITGNSIHYILDSSGVILDALPGLYSPQKFRDYLDRLGDLAGSKTYSSRTASFYRTETASMIVDDWRSKLTRLGKTPDLPSPDTAIVRDSPTDPPTAIDAAPIAVTKMFAELPTVLSLAPEIERLRFTTQVDDWKPLALLGGEIRFSPESIAMMRAKTSNLDDSAFAALLENLKTYVALDTAQNEFRFHTTILTWLNPVSSTRLKEFNDTVYSDLFLTPAGDKWLGLYSSDIYSAIENNGIL